MENRIEKVWFEDSKVFISTTSGDVLNHPLKWFPRLLNASDEALQQYEISPLGIHWLLLDEDLSLSGFYHYQVEEQKVL